jgi:hypothetical protein
MCPALSHRDGVPNYGGTFYRNLFQWTCSLPGCYNSRREGDTHPCTPPGRGIFIIVPLERIKGWFPDTAHLNNI